MAALKRTLFHGGEVIDGTGAESAQLDVVVSGDQITEVGTSLDGDVHVNASGLTLIPGLFDCHVHVTTDTIDILKQVNRPYSYRYFVAADSLRRILDCGITTVRDAGGADAGIRAATDDELIDGPRMQVAISMLSQTGGHGDPWTLSDITLGWDHDLPGRPREVVDGVDEMRLRVRQLVRSGAGVIKVCSTGGVLSPTDDPRRAQFSEDELKTAVTEAEDAGIYVMSHAMATEGIQRALRAGVRSIEHGVYLDEETVDMMLSVGAFFVPTLSAPHSILEAVEKGAVISSQMIEKCRMTIEHHQRSVQLAIDAGVKIAMGSDAVGYPHGQNLLELEYLRQAGMKPLDCLVAATSTAAELLGMKDRLGTIEAGKTADLVGITGDPTDFKNLKERIRFVYKDGRLVRGSTDVAGQA